MENKAHVLWTGGWDSTFRIVELSRQDIDVYPVYVINPERASREIEMRRIGEIMEDLRNMPTTKARLHDVEFINRHDIPPDPEITAAYELLHETCHLGTQYEWLARLGKIKPGLELGATYNTPETSSLRRAIHNYGHLVIEDTVGYLDPEKSSKEGMLVLGWFRFPLITRTEVQMHEKIQEWGYEEVMKKIWFCHKPIHNFPCGFCHPCEYKMDVNMSFLLPKRSRARYHIQVAVSKVFGEKGKNFVEKIARKLPF